MGIWVGLDVGAPVGRSVGSAVGLAVGICVGKLVGTSHFPLLQLFFCKWRRVSVAAIWLLKSSKRLTKSLETIFESIRSSGDGDECFNNKSQGG